MKKIICFILAAMMAAAPLCSCESAEKEKDALETTATLPDYAGKEIKEYDENGNFILSSTEDRHVYVKNDGYVVVTFLGESVNKIERVYSCESAEKAEEKGLELCRGYVEDGKVPPIYKVNGSLLIVTVPFDSEATDGLESYYLKPKAEVEKAFDTAGEH